MSGCYPVRDDDIVVCGLCDILWSPNRVCPGLMYDGWRDDIAIVNSTGCWVWVGTSMPWQAARALIRAEHRVTDAAPCRVTPACVNPLHSLGTTAPAGAAS